MPWWRWLRRLRMRCRSARCRRRPRAGSHSRSIPAVHHRTVLKDNDRLRYSKTSASPTRSAALCGSPGMAAATACDASAAAPWTGRQSVGRRLASTAPSAGLRGPATTAAWRLGVGTADELLVGRGRRCRRWSRVGIPRRGRGQRNCTAAAGAESLLVLHRIRARRRGSGTPARRGLEALRGVPSVVGTVPLACGLGGRGESSCASARGAR